MRFKSITTHAVPSTTPQGSGDWVKTHAAQVIVCVNGIILTVTAFLVLSLFIRGLLKEEYVQMGQDYLQTVTTATEDVYRDFMSLHDVYAAASGTDRIPNISPTLDRVSSSFDQVFYVRAEDPLSRGVSGLLGSVDRHPAYQTPLRTLQPNMRVALQQQLSLQPKPVFVLATNIPQTKLVRIESAANLEVRPFALVARLKRQDGQTDMLVAFTRFDRLLSSEWIQRKDTLRTLQILTSNDIALLRTERSGSISSGDVGKVRMVPIGPYTLSVQIDMWKSGKLDVLYQLPFFVLIFGAILTLVGTFYVHNNQTQSVRLKGMNKALTNKNLELNAQVQQTERLNQAVRKSEREHKAIIDAISDIIFETDTDGTIRFVNQTWTRITGFDRDQTLGMNLFEILYPSDQDVQRRQFSMLVSGIGAAYRTITRLRTADGTYHEVELAFSMLRKDENQQARVVGTVTDIEDRRRAEKALSEAEKKYRSIWENAPDGIYQMTPEGQILLANPAMAQIFGYDSADQMLREVQNAHKTLFVRTADRQSVVQKLLKGQSVIALESEAVRRDGSTIWVSESVRPVTEGADGIVYFEGSIENITDRKKAETALREAKMASDVASRVKSEFLSNMSHELRTPLNAIIGFSEIIKNEVFGPIEQRSYWEYARDIHDSGRRLLSVINDILDLSRIDAGERELNDSVVDINKVIRVCVERLQAKADSQQQTISIQVPERLPTLIAEETSLRQMLMNLLSNAIKYSPASAIITIAAGIDEGSGAFRLSVTDTGVGLDESEIRRILEPFGRAESAMTRSDSGAGLGLTLVNALIRLHKGHIEMTSQKGLGTTVSLIFPPSRVQMIR